MFAENKRRKSGWLGRLVVTVVLLAVFYAAGLAWFAQGLPREAGDAPPRAEAIVVLTGGAERVDRGLDLLDRGLAEKLFISGVYHAVEVNALIELAENQPEHLACCIVLGYEAGDTRGNAIETAAWMEAEGYGSLILVTAVYHMPRSLIEFQRVMPEAEIVPSPVYPRNFHLEDWYAWPGSASLLITEFAKYLLASAWAALSPPPGAPGGQ